MVCYFTSLLYIVYYILLHIYIYIVSLLTSNGCMFLEMLYGFL